MAVETRTLNFTLDPALRAYFAWIEKEGAGFSLEAFDLFAAGYRAREDEEAAGTPSAGQPQAAGGEGDTDGRD